jgi:hypothetical protein
MKKLKQLIFTTCIVSGLLFTVVADCYSQTISPKASPACGGYFSAGGKSLSWTLGETFNTTLTNGTKMLSQGEQQPYFLRTFNLKVFIEGYYAGSGTLTPHLFTAEVSLDPTACDSITVELHDANTPFALYKTTKALVHTDGSAQVSFPGVVANNSYYIAVLHRNAMETWSKTPIQFNDAVARFDLTSP